MATVLQTRDEEDQQQQMQGPAAPTISSGEGAATAAPVGAMSQSAPKVGGAQKPTSSGRFTNIQKYIQANTGADYAKQLGEKQEQGASAVRQGIESARQQTQQQASPELQRLQQAGQITQQALQNPEEFTQNQANLESFQKIREGQYLRGVGLQNEAQLANQLQDVQNRAQMAGTEQGRFQLLREQFGQRPGRTYSTGQQRLDQLLLQGQRGQLGTLAQKAQQEAAATGQALTGAQQQAQALTGQLQTLGSQAQQQAQEALTGKIGETKSGLEQRAAALQAEREGQFEALRSGLERGEITEEQAQQLGFNPEEDVRLYGVDPTQLLNRAALGQATAGHVATEQDRARLAALSQLSGQTELPMFAAAPTAALRGIGETFGREALQQQQAAGQARIADIQAQAAAARSPLESRQHDVLRGISGNWQLGGAGGGIAGRARIGSMSTEELARAYETAANPLIAQQDPAFFEHMVKARLGSQPFQEISGIRGQLSQMASEEAAAKDAAGYNRMLRILRAQQQAPVGGA